MRFTFPLRKSLLPTREKKSRNQAGTDRETNNRFWHEIEISDTEFRISITLDLPDDPSPPTFLLQVRYPDDYPDKAPHLDILAPPNAAPHEFFSVGDDRDALLSGLASTVEENLGMAMVFALVSTLKEAAEQLVLDRLAVREKKHEEAVLAAERAENAKFHGEPVTRESFLRWRDGFLREMEELRRREEDERAAEAKKSKTKDPGRLSGRQLWEGGLAGKDGEDVEEDDDEDGADEVPVEGVQKLKVEAS